MKVDDSDDRLKSLGALTLLVLMLVFSTAVLVLAVVAISGCWHVFEWIVGGSGNATVILACVVLGWFPRSTPGALPNDSPAWVQSLRISGRRQEFVSADRPKCQLNSQLTRTQTGHVSYGRGGFC